MSETDRKPNLSPSTANNKVSADKIHSASPTPEPTNLESSSAKSPSPVENSNANSDTSKAKTMDWQRVAHKLREYNRKLLKKVFKLEQDLAEVENKFQKHLEKSQASDSLNAQQAEEIKKYQQDNDRLEQQLAISQQESQSQKIELQRLAKELEFSQKQSAQLERECALLQENYNKKTYELIATGKEARELHSRLNRQQNYTLQYKTALERYVSKSENKSTPVESQSTSPSTPRRDPLPNVKNTPIKAWSGSSIEKLALPKTKSQILPIKNNLHSPKKSESSKTKSSDWIAPEIDTKGKKIKKPQSLAAVELPQLPK